MIKGYDELVESRLSPRTLSSDNMKIIFAVIQRRWRFQARRYGRIDGRGIRERVICLTDGRMARSRVGRNYREELYRHGVASPLPRDRGLIEK